MWGLGAEHIVKGAGEQCVEIEARKLPVSSNCGSDAGCLQHLVRSDRPVRPLKGFNLQEAKSNYLHPIRCLLRLQSSIITFYAPIKA